MAHPVLRSPTRIEDDVRRFACDRCRSHKLRCERQLLIGVPRKTVPCSRCIKQGHHCATTPQHRNARERHGKIRRQLGQQSATSSSESGLEDSAESDDQDGEPHPAREVDMDDYHPADDSINPSTIGRVQDSQATREGIVREDHASSTSQAHNAGIRNSVSNQGPTNTFPPIDPQLFSPYQLQDSDIDRMLRDAHSTSNQTIQRESDPSYFADIDFSLSDASQTDRMQTDTDTLWSSNQQPTGTAYMQTPATSVNHSSTSDTAAGETVATGSMARKMNAVTSSIYKDFLLVFDQKFGQRENGPSSSIGGLQDKAEDYISHLEAIVRESEVAALQDITPRPGDSRSSDQHDLPSTASSIDGNLPQSSSDIISRLDRLSLFTAIASSYQSLLQVYHQVFGNISKSLTSGGQSGQTALAMLPKFQMLGTKNVMSKSLQVHMTIEMASHTLDRIESQLRLIITAYQTEEDEIQMIAIALLSALIYTPGDTPTNLSAAVRDTIRGIGRGMCFSTRET